MRTEEVLAAIATGIWRWDDATGRVTLDAEAARLLGLPAEPASLTASGARSHFHPVDWNEIQGIVGLAVAEGTLAEARLRIMDEKGRVLRTVRARSKPIVRARPDDSRAYELIGTLQEVAEPRPGTAIEGSSVTGDWRRSREAFLLDAGRALAEARSTAEVLRVASSLSMPGFSPDGLAVFSASPTQEGLRIVGILGNTAADADGFSSLTVESDYPASEVIRTGRAIYLPTAESYKERYPEMWPLVEPFERNSWAFLPLTVAGRTLGTWMAAFKNRVAFSPDERSVLNTVARMLAQALARAGVTESERELSLGLQRSMMPTLNTDIPGMSVAARYVPTGGGLQVGGDWYDMIPLPGGTTEAEGRGSGRFALVIGDVQGHDVRAAGLMGQLRIALRAYAAEGHRPDAVLSRASRFLAGMRQLPGPDSGGGTGAPYAVGGDGSADATMTDEEYERTGPRFATCLYMEVDPENGTLEIARAGHLDPVFRMPDGTAFIRQTAGGLPLGIEADSDYPTTQIVLQPGELLMLCTDGLVETGGHDLATGWDRLRPVLEGDTESSLEELADALMGVVHGPGSHYMTGPLPEHREDDIALVLLARDGSPTRADRQPPPRRTVLTIAQAEPERIAGARRQLRDLLHDWSDDEQVDAAVLMVSEMVTNVLVHTDGDALLVAEAAGERGDRRLRVEVADVNDELPHRRRPGELASSGRGLVLMEVLADAWGVNPRGEGKSIWFELYESGDHAPAPEEALPEA
ncbi:SpoIIE family protein phosphatase [Streptomyces liangshanensis]|uniref:SpoIIE family protein phosphatase n=1 Tax=Streptomyces liangshanensis TaxID=2717324 RepID=A0A6G9GZM2_9ACTN|nr:SpoIIE family protein phosphatase [Streptomyces liangshanensis]QIQ03732.1 SpoIIE family protein phosphatase [Streptomyces liangshanensis]